MADLPIAEDNGQLPVTINDPTTPTSSVAVDPNGSIHTLADLSGSGSIAALNGVVTATTHGCGSCNFNITGTWVATLTIQGTVDGTNWFTVYGIVIGTDAVTQFVSNNLALDVPCGGLSQVRLIATAYTSGTATITWNAGAGIKAIVAISPVAASFNATVQPGNTPNTVAWLAKPPDANLWVTGTAATGVALTATLPAVAAQFHHINTIEIEAYTTAARTGGVTPVLVTSTNLPGSPVWTFATAAAIGTTDSKVFSFPSAINSSVVNTATTIVCPATTGIIWRVNVSYYTSA